jgi:glycosyltransferase involved in cell wall biosynthesis
MEPRNNCDISIIIPVYNEEKTLAVLINKVKAVDFSPYAAEIIAVDDGSKDETPRILSSFNGIKVVTLPQNSGKGSAIQAGLKQAGGEYVIIQDADLEYEPEDIKTMFFYAKNNDSPIVYGSRNLNKKNKRAGFLFYSGGVFLSLLTNFLYGTKITDEPTCYKLFRRDVIEKIKVRSRRFEFCPEVTAKAARLGYKIKEIPISYAPRSVKEGKKIKVWDGFEAVWTLIKYRFVPVSRF